MKEAGPLEADVHIVEIKVFPFGLTLTDLLSEVKHICPGPEWQQID